MTLPRARCRLGLGLLFSAFLACLNPRPDDEPMNAPVIVDPGDRDDGVVSAPPMVDLNDPLAGEGGGSANGGSPSAPTNLGSPGPNTPAADAGTPPDAGPVDDRDAGASDD